MEKNCEKQMSSRLKIPADELEQFSINLDYLATLLFEKDNIVYDKVYCAKLWLKELFLEA